MSDKRTLTIQFPALDVMDEQGRHWWPFDETERFYAGQPGHRCDVCEGSTWRGFKRGVTSIPESMSYLCTGCVELVNPWEGR